MNDLPWFPWSNEYREDEWFLSLTCGQRWAWVALLSRANETAWVLRDNLLRALRVTARVIQCDEADLEALIESAKAAKKLVRTENGDWLVAAGDKYRQQKQQRDNAARQQRHRDGALRVTESNTTPHHITPDQTTPDQEEKNPPAPPCPKPDLQEIYQQVQTGFAELHKAFPLIPALKTLNVARKRLIERRFKDPGFDWPLILKIVRSSPFLRGEAQPRNGQDKPFAFNFDFVFARSSRWLEILEGKYGLPEPERPAQSKEQTGQPAYIAALEAQWAVEDTARRADPEAMRKAERFLKRGDQIRANAETHLRSGKVESAAQVLENMTHDLTTTKTVKAPT